MSEEPDSGEKEHEPTERKLDDARRKGEIPRSTDLTTAASYAGLVLFGLSLGAARLRSLGETGMVLFDQAERLAPLTASGATPPVGGLMLQIGAALTPLFLTPLLAVIAMVVALRALVFAPDKLRPKASRISPLANAKNKFGRSGLFEFAKSFAKLMVISALLWVFLRQRLPRIVGTIHLSPAMIAVELMWLVVEFLTLVVVIMFLIGAADFLWQRKEHFRKQRMSHKELHNELKRSEGDPQLRQQRRQRGRELASNRMLSEVPNADVVIVNPVHFAVALKWHRKGAAAPVCVAKGADEIAARIRERAAESGVPIRHDPATARALHAAVALGEEIRPEHYRPVAAAIRFAEAMRAKARGRRS